MDHQNKPLRLEEEIGAVFMVTPTRVVIPACGQVHGCASTDQSSGSCFPPPRSLRACRRTAARIFSAMSNRCSRPSRLRSNSTEQVELGVVERGVENVE